MAGTVCRKGVGVVTNLHVQLRGIMMYEVFDMLRVSTGRSLFEMKLTVTHGRGQSFHCGAGSPQRSVGLHLGDHCGDSDEEGEPAGEKEALEFGDMVQVGGPDTDPSVPRDATYVLDLVTVVA